MTRVSESRSRTDVEGADKWTGVVSFRDDGRSRSEEFQGRPDVLWLRRLLLIVFTKEELEQTLRWTIGVVVKDVDELAENLESGAMDLDDIVLEVGVDGVKGVRTTERLGLKSSGESWKTEACRLTDMRAFVGSECVVQCDLQMPPHAAISIESCRGGSNGDDTHELLIDDFLRYHL